MQQADCLSLGMSGEDSESVFKLRSEIQGGGGDSQLKDPEKGTNLLGSYVRGTKTKPMCLDLSRGKIKLNLFYASICFYFSGSLTTFHLIDIFLLDVRTKTFFFQSKIFGYFNPYLRICPWCTLTSSAKLKIPPNVYVRGKKGITLQFL